MHLDEEQILVDLVNELYSKTSFNVFISSLALDLAPQLFRANQVMVGIYDTMQYNKPSSAPMARLNLNTKDIRMSRLGVAKYIVKFIQFIAKLAI